MRFSAFRPCVLPLRVSRGFRRVLVLAEPLTFRFSDLNSLAFALSVSFRDVFLSFPFPLASCFGGGRFFWACPGSGGGVGTSAALVPGKSGRPLGEVVFSLRRGCRMAFPPPQWGLNLVLFWGRGSYRHVCRHFLRRRREHNDSR